MTIYTVDYKGLNIINHYASLDNARKEIESKGARMVSDIDVANNERAHYVVDNAFFGGTSDIFIGWITTLD